jgi:AraC family transcriptional activator of pobA
LAQELCIQNKMKTKEKGLSYFTLKEWIAKDGKDTIYNTKDCFVIIWTSSERLAFLIDGEPVCADSNQLLYVSPNRKISFNNQNEVAIVYVFTQEFYIRSDFDSSIINSWLFYNEEQAITICPFAETIEIFKLLYVDRLEHLENASEATFALFAHNIIEGLLLEGKRSSQKTLMVQEHALPDKVILNKFTLLLQQHFNKERRVSYYADMLNVTPRTLNKATYNVTQKHAKDIIIEKVIKESKTLLNYTHDTIYCTAWKVGFTDEGNFSSFFKKHSGISPADYREMKKLESNPRV